MHRPLRGTLTAALAAAALVLAGCGGTNTSSSGDAPAEKLLIANMADNNSFDRAALEIGHRVQYWMPVFDTLLVLDQNAEPQPNLATEWSYNTDSTVLDLKLREGVKFTDGAVFDAKAVQANLEDLAKGTGQNAYMAKSIEKYEIVGPTEIKLHLSAPDPGLIGYLCVVGGAMASPDSLGKDSSATTPVGSGPYTLDASATTGGSRYTYKRNADYWNAKAFPYNEIVIKPIQDNTARLNAVKTGQVDIAAIEPKTVKEAEGSQLDVARNPVDWQGLFIADRDGKMVKALADVRVRQAINYVFDKESLFKNLQVGEGEITSQPFNPKSQAFVPELDTAYAKDVAKAKQLMADAGFADGFTVKMPDLASFPQMAPVISDQLGQLNIKIDWVKVAADATIPEILSGKFPMFFFSLGSQSAWQDMRKFAFPASPWNTAHVDDPKMDALLKTAQTAQGSAQDQAMQEVNRYLVENAWLAPWYRVNILMAHSKRVAVTVQPWNAAPWISGFAPA